MMRLKTTTQLLATLAVAGSSACADEPSQAAWSVVDSAGVVVLTGPPAERSLAVVEEVPQLTLSEAAGAPWFRASDVLPRSDGSFTVLDRGNHRLVVLRADGSLVATAGQQGDGPGEFQAPAVATLWADSVFVYDGRHGRVTVYDANLELARSRTLEAADGFSRPRFTGIGPGGQWLGYEFVRSVGGPAPDGHLRSPVRFIAIDPAGIRVLAEGKGGERWVRQVMEGGQLAAVDVLNYSFFRNTMMAASNDLLVFGDTDSWDFSVLDTSGQVLRRLRMDLPADAFGPAGIDRYLDTQTDREPAELLELRQRLEAITLPPTTPAFSRFLIDDSARIWVEQFTPESRAVRTWHVFDSTGAIGTVQTPMGFSLSAVRDGLLYGVYRDDFDVESVRVYGLMENQ